MKTQKMNIAKLTALFLLSIVSLMACKQQGTKSEQKETKQSIEAPKMDLHAATFMGNIEAVKQHIKIGSDLNVTEPMGGSTPLISASLFGKSKIAILLIEADADVNLTNNDGSTALHTAAFFGRTEIVKALLTHGADKSIKNKSGSTALESVAAPFANVKGIYDFFGKELGPMGLKLNYEELEKTRPVIAEILKQ